ncbi:STAS domain-containing protein [Paractinoplanes pyxinae]|uniref:STAS domain-containing protein n=1 Tax=Paractinoplanes pyxinae TaxID=2997416 RepID=UPI0034DB6A12
MTVIAPPACCPSSFLQGNLVPQGSTVLLCLHGDIDVDTTDHLAHLFAHATAGTPGDVVVDLAGVDFLGAAGVRALLIHAEDLDRRHLRLQVVNPRPLIHEVLRIGGVPVTDTAETLPCP